MKSILLETAVANTFYVKRFTYITKLERIDNNRFNCIFKVDGCYTNRKIEYKHILLFLINFDSEKETNSIFQFFRDFAFREKRLIDLRVLGYLSHFTYSYLNFFLAQFP